VAIESDEGFMPVSIPPNPADGAIRTEVRRRGAAVSVELDPVTEAEHGQAGDRAHQFGLSVRAGLVKERPQLCARC